MNPQIRKTVLWIHLYGGLLAALFLAVLGFTGGVMVFEPQIDHWLNPKLNWVQPSGGPLGLGELSRRLEAVYPGEKVSSVRFGDAPDLADQVGLHAPGTKKWRNVAVNPYTAEVMGSLDSANIFVRKVHQLHTSLMMGKVGEEIGAWSCLVLLVIALSGLVLWWPFKLWKFRDLPLGRRVNFELHNVFGFYSSLILMIFALTAVMMHWDAVARSFIYRVTGTSAPKAEPAAVIVPQGGKLGLDELAAKVNEAVPGAAMMWIRGLDGDKPVQVTLKFPEDHTPIGRTEVQIDPYTGKVLKLDSSRTLPPAKRVLGLWNRQVHTGDIYGWPSRIVACLASFSLPLLAITGPLLWWNRRRRNA